MGQEHSQTSNAAAEQQAQEAQLAAPAAAVAASSTSSASSLPTSPAAAAPMHRSDSRASMSSDSSFEIMDGNGDDAASPRTQPQAQAPQLQRASSRSWAALAAGSSASPSRPDSRCSNASSFELIDRSATPSLVGASAAPHSALSSPLHMHALADSRAVSFGAESVDSFAAADACSMPTTPLNRSSRASPRSASPVSMLCALQSPPADAIALSACPSLADEAEAEDESADASFRSEQAVNAEQFGYLWPIPDTDDDLDDGLRDDPRADWMPNAQLRQRQQSALGTRVTYKSQMSRKQHKEEARVKLACFRAVRQQVRDERAAASASAAPKQQHPAVIALSTRTRVSPAVAAADSVELASAESDEDAEYTESRAARRARMQSCQQRNMKHRSTQAALRVAKRLESLQQHLPYDPTAKQVPYDPRSTSRRALNPLLLKDQPAAAIAAANRKASGPRWLVRHSARQTLEQFAEALRPLVMPAVHRTFDDASAGLALHADLALPPVALICPNERANAQSFKDFMASRRASQQTLSSVELRVVSLSEWQKHEGTFVGHTGYLSLRAHYKHAGAEWKAARKHLLDQGPGDHPEPSVREPQLVCAVVHPEGAAARNLSFLPRRIAQVHAISFRYRHRRQFTKRIDTHHLLRLRQTLEKLHLGLQIPLMALQYSAPVSQRHMHREQAVTKQQSRRVKKLLPASKELVQRERKSADRIRALESTDSRDYASRGQAHSAFARGLESAGINNEAFCPCCCCDDSAWFRAYMQEDRERKAEAQRLLDEEAEDRAFDESRERRRIFTEQVAAAARQLITAKAAAAAASLAFASASVAAPAPSPAGVDFELIDRSATPSLIGAAAATPHSALNSPLLMHALADSRAYASRASLAQHGDGSTVPAAPDPSPWVHRVILIARVSPIKLRNVMNWTEDNAPHLARRILAILRARRGAAPAADLPAGRAEDDAEEAAIIAALRLLGQTDIIDAISDCLEEDRTAKQLAAMTRSLTQLYDGDRSMRYTLESFADVGVSARPSQISSSGLVPAAQRDAAVAAALAYAKQPTTLVTVWFERTDRSGKTSDAIDALWNKLRQGNVRVRTIVDQADNGTIQGRANLETAKRAVAETARMQGLLVAHRSNPNSVSSKRRPDPPRHRPGPNAAARAAANAGRKAGAKRRYDDEADKMRELREELPNATHTRLAVVYQSRHGGELLSHPRVGELLDPAVYERKKQKDSQRASRQRLERQVAKLSAGIPPLLTPAEFGAVKKQRLEEEKATRETATQDLRELQRGWPRMTRPAGGDSDSPAAAAADHAVLQSSNGAASVASAPTAEAGGEWEIATPPCDDGFVCDCWYCGECERLGVRVTIKSTITRKMKKQEKAHDPKQIAKTKAAAAKSVALAAASAAANSQPASAAADEEMTWRQMKQQRREQLAAKFGACTVVKSSAPTVCAPSASAASAPGSGGAEPTSVRGRDVPRTTAPNKRAQREAKRAILSVVRASADEDREPASRLSSIGLLSAQRKLQRKDAAKRAQLQTEERAIPEEAVTAALILADDAHDDAAPSRFEQRAAMTSDVEEAELKEDAVDKEEPLISAPDSPELVSVARAHLSREEIDDAVEAHAEAHYLARVAACASTDLELAEDELEAAYFSQDDHASSVAADFGFDSPAVAPLRRFPLPSSSIVRPELRPASFDGPFQRVWAKNWMVKNMTVNKKTKGRYNHAVKPKTVNAMERLGARSQRSSSRAVEE